MRMTVLIQLFCLTLWAQPSAENRVLEIVGEMAKQGGRVVFSDLYNSERFNQQEKIFLARLYEIFFQIPGTLKAEYQSTGKIPTRAQLAATFGISQRSVELLLRVMASDPRVPPLFSRHAESGEIESVSLENIETFLKAHGNQVRITQWEGKALPAFELATFKGGTIRAADLAGKNTLIYFWFTGCPPCVRIAPLLAELDSRYASSNFQVLGLNADRVLEVEATDEERAKHLKKAGARFVNAHLDQATRGAFGGVNIFPTLFLVKTDATIFRHLINYQDRETLEKHITDLLDSSGK